LRQQQQQQKEVPVPCLVQQQTVTAVLQLRLLGVWWQAGIVLRSHMG
jgi:hypothetical protein